MRRSIRSAGKLGVPMRIRVQRLSVQRLSVQRPTVQRLALLGLLASGAAFPAAPRPAPSLLEVNAVRRLAALPPVGTDVAWAAQCRAHAQYLVRTDRGEHREDPASPHRTPAGEACAHGHYFVSSQAAAGPERALAYWAAGPFHLPQLIDPRLRRVALGVAHDAAGSVQSAVVLDVRRGLSGPGAYPVRFPAPGVRSPLREAARSEWPDPLPACAGYAAPVGAPMALLLGPGQTVQAAALKVNGKPAPACLLTAGRYRGASGTDTRVGRGVLAAQGAAVLLPRFPLPAGAEVRVSFAAQGKRHAWSFRVR